MDAAGILLVVATVPAVHGFGWMTFVALDRKRASRRVHTAAGAVTAVLAVKLSRFHAS